MIPTRESRTFFLRPNQIIWHFPRFQRNKQTPLTALRCKRLLYVKKDRLILSVRKDEGVKNCAETVSEQLKLDFPYLLSLPAKFDIPWKARSAELSTFDARSPSPSLSPPPPPPSLSSSSSTSSWSFARCGAARRGTASRRRLYERT